MFDKVFKNVNFVNLLGFIFSIQLMRETTYTRVNIFNTDISILVSNRFIGYAEYVTGICNSRNAWVFFNCLRISGNLPKVLVTKSNFQWRILNVLKCLRTHWQSNLVDETSPTEINLKPRVCVSIFWKILGGSFWFFNVKYC